jgi:hypothetical protein
MTNGTATPTSVPSAIAGDAQVEPGWGFPLRVAIPTFLFPPPSYTDLPPWWTPRRDWALVASLELEDMWASVVNQVATKFAALGFAVSDSQDSTVRTKRAQDLLHGLDGWVPFAIKVVQDYLTTDNGIFIRLRRAGEKTEKVKLKAFDGTTGPAFSEVAVSNASPGARINAIYHLDSLRCTRTGNLIYPVHYIAVDGTHHLLRWDQVLFTADMISPRAEMYGVGKCAASRAYKTVTRIASMEQMGFEFVAGRGANKLAFVQGISEATLKGIIKAGQAEADAKGLQYYLGAILGAIPSDTPISTVEILLKQLPQGFSPREEREDARLIYAKAVGISPGEVQPNPAGLNSGKREEIQSDQAKGYGLAAFVKWFEQTFSRRVLPETTELKITDEHDIENQKKKAEVQKLRAETRAVQIQSGEINPPLSRQLAVDAEDLPREVLQQDATSGGQLSDDEKPLPDSLPNAAALQLIQSLPLTPPKEQQGMQTKEQRMADILARAANASAEEIEWLATAIKSSGAQVATELVRRYREADQELKRLGIEPIAYRIGDTVIPATKAVDHVDTLIDSEYDAALDVLRRLADGLP